MVRKLLEADKPNLQILGTNSVSEIYCLYSLVKFTYSPYWCIVTDLERHVEVITW